VAEFNFDVARRWARIDPHKTLTRRGDNKLPIAKASSTGGQELLLYAAPVSLRSGTQ
jgi:hypothetical protein